MTDSSTPSLAPGTAVLRAAYPNANFPQETVDLYERCLSDLDADQVVAAIRALVLTSKWMPTVAEIRGRVAEKSLQLPSVSEAWSNVDASEHPAVLMARRRTGDSWRWRTAQEWELRRDFEKSYADVRADLMEEAMLGERPMQPMIEMRKVPTAQEVIEAANESYWADETAKADRERAARDA